MTTTLHPRGVNHLALGTRDMKGQLEFWCDVLGCPLRALYYMHGVDGAFHGFVELAPESYVAFVQHRKKIRVVRREGVDGLMRRIPERIESG